MKKRRTVFIPSKDSRGETEMRLRGRVAIVTGGGGGIGKATCLAFAREGADIVIPEVNIANAETVSEEIIALGRRCTVIETDVADGHSVREMVKGTIDEFGRIDILVNNAGIFSYTRIDACTETEWDRMMAVNLKGPFLCSQAVMETMKTQKFGRIINLGSLAGQVGGLVASAPYSASKAGVMCLTKSFARVLGEYGITVNSIAPGIAATEMAKNHPDMTDQIPLGRVADPSEVANVILFLASEEGQYITGATLDVNGGIRMG